jgi:hypothetical protein
VFIYFHQIAVQVTYKYKHHKPVKYKILHSSDFLNLLKEEVMKNYKDLKMRNFYFVYEKENVEFQFQNKYNFNIFIFKYEFNSNNYILNSLKVIENDKKPFSVWDIKKVFSEILQKNYISLEKMSYLDMKILHSLKHKFSKKNLETFV